MKLPRYISRISVAFSPFAQHKRNLCIELILVQKKTKNKTLMLGIIRRKGDGDPCFKRKSNTSIANATRKQCWSKTVNLMAS